MSASVSQPEFLNARRRESVLDRVGSLLAGIGPAPAVGTAAAAYGIALETAYREATETKETR